MYDACMLPEGSIYLLGVVMKIISWNVNGIRACSKKGMFEFFEEQKPDIFCLQETKAHPEQVEDSYRQPMGMTSYWTSAFRKGYSGTATYCLETPKQVQHGIGIRKYDNEGRFVITRHQDFLLYNVYFPNGGASQERHDFKQEFLVRFNAHLRRQLEAGEAVIVLGDYNVAHEEVDVHDPKRLSKESGFLPEERQWFDQFLELGFHDCFRELHPNAKERYSWWSYRENARIANRGWRIDYICVSQNLRKRVTAAEVLDQVEGSDHCPIVLELD